MKKFVIILAALMIVLPLSGCGEKVEDSGPVVLPDGTTPDEDALGDNNAPGGAENETPL